MYFSFLVFLWKSSYLQSIILFFAVSPKRWVLLHIFVWILGLTGIAFIFLSHGHYSIDIIIAFFIASRMFAGHHAIADNINLMRRNRGLLKKWFPIMYAMEYNCQGIVPNEFEWPFPTRKRIKRFFMGKRIAHYISEI